MPEFIPHGYFSVRDALDRLGRELFQSEWTGAEHKARRLLISVNELLQMARRSGVPVTRRMPRSTKARATKPASHSSSDRSEPSHQEEIKARKRQVAAHHRLRQLLEAGKLKAAILDPSSGKIHQASVSVWRRLDADQMIEKAQAPIPGSLSTGTLLIKRFAEAKVDAKPMPAAKFQEAIKALKEKMATESLTRVQQRNFVRETFPKYRVTERQLTQIFRAVPAPIGRPRKSDKKV